jgi:hypothetical protein
MAKIQQAENTLKLEISALEKYYGAKYVGEFPLPDGEGFADSPASIFWRPKTIRTSNQTEYFGITGVIKRPFGNNYSVVDAGYITGYIFNGLQHGKTVKYSRFEADRQSFPNEAYIEGGFSRREWDAGTNKAATLVRLRVIDGAIAILE